MNGEWDCVLSVDPGLLTCCFLRVRGHYRDGPLCPLFQFLRKECLTTLLPSSDSIKQPSEGSAARFFKYYLNPAVLIGNEPPAGNDSEFTLR